jgi:tetratricopeptide (TPR) repeat protein
MPGVSYDVFISYSSRDKSIADGICAVLERHGIRCWIAPRDVLPGADWGQSIVRGIAGARIFVLVFSNFANASSQVRREVERAAHRELPIIPFRVENVEPNDSLEFFISTRHWLDAFNPPMERHVERLADTIKKLLGDQSEEARSAPVDIPRQPSPPAPDVATEPEPETASRPDAIVIADTEAQTEASDVRTDRVTTAAHLAPSPDVGAERTALEEPVDRPSIPPEGETDVSRSAEQQAFESSRQAESAMPPDQARSSAPFWWKSWPLWAGLLILVTAGVAVFLMPRPSPPKPKTQAAAIDPLWSDCHIGRPSDAVLRACTALIEAGKLSPEDMAKALTARGTAYFFKRDFDAALQDESAAIRVQPTHVRSYVDRGYIYLSKGDFARAISDYTTAIRLAPMAGVYNDRGLAFAAQKNYPAAIQDFSSAIRQKPKLMAAYVNRGLAYGTIGNCGAAVQDYDKAIQLKPGQGNVYLLRGNCLQQLGKPDAAIRDYDAAIRQAPNAALGYLSRAMAFAAESRRELAVRDFSTAARLDPKDFHAYYGRANVYYAQGKYDQAIADYRIAIQLNPGYPMTYSNIGNAYYASRQYARAIANYDAAIRLKPDYAGAYRNRAMAERASGKPAAAAADENKAKRLGYKP